MSKSFGPFQAVQDVSFDVLTGSVHALIGENGAGKTTLMRLLYGLYAPDSGTIAIGGQSVRLKGPADGLKTGISMVHQQSLLLTRLTIAENVLLSSHDRRPVRRRQVEDALDRLAAEHVIPVDPRAKVSQLSGAARQRAELLIALYHQATIIILDEPTTILTPQEVEQLIATLRRLKEAGRTMLFVTHKLNEVMAISDTVTIMRRGAVVRTCATSATSTEELTVAILGLRRDGAGDRDKSDQAAASLVLGTGNGANRAAPEAAKAVPDGPELLRADDLVVRGASGVTRVDSVSLSMREGEILAITGIEGNGQRELAETVVGVRHSESGRLRLSGAEITRANIRRRRDLGLGYVPEDRVGVGICADLSVADNVAAGTHRTASLCRHGLRNRAGWAELAATVVSKYRVACGSTNDPISALSGGNAQKVVLGREVERDPALLVAIQPTQGLDIGSTARIWDELRSLRDRGRSVLLVSTDFAEVRALADRALVMVDGRVAAELPRAELDEERIGRAALSGAS